MGEVQVFSCAVLQAFEVFLEKGVILFCEAVDHPLGGAFTNDDSKILHVAELFGDFHLI